MMVADEQLSQWSQVESSPDMQIWSFLSDFTEAWVIFFVNATTWLFKFGGNVKVFRDIKFLTSVSVAQQVYSMVVDNMGNSATYVLYIWLLEWLVVRFYLWLWNELLTVYSLCLCQTWAVIGSPFDP